MTARNAPVPCTRCGVEVAPLDLFSGNVCLPCYAMEHENDTNDDLLADIVRGFGGR
jgi:hypothetical protein